MEIESYSPDWTDSDEEEEEEDFNSMDPTRKVKVLEKKLALAKQSLDDYRALVAEKLNVSKEVASPEDLSSNVGSSSERDDDTHYFESYGSNG